MFQVIWLCISDTSWQLVKVPRRKTILLFPGHSGAAEARRWLAVVVWLLPKHPADTDGIVTKHW
jgi:hypothetical protein